MLSYQHGYHAGNHADVLKHATLCLCLEALGRKDSPYFLLDTHAGAGLYDLQDAAARQTAEADLGISRLWPKAAAALPRSYASTLRHLNPRGPLRTYPGSCWLMAEALRHGDQAAFCERHPGEFEALEQNLARRRGLALLHADGYAQARALLPPAAKRGLVLIDPSYETAQDYTQVPKLVADIHHRFRAAMVLVWYPLLAGAERLEAQLARIGAGKADATVFSLDVGQIGSGMQGSAMYVLNPPWKLDEQLAACMDTIAPMLRQGDGAEFRAQSLG